MSIGCLPSNHRIIAYLDTCLSGSSKSIFTDELGPEMVFNQLSQKVKGQGDLWLDNQVDTRHSLDGIEAKIPGSWPGGANFAMALTHDVDFITSTTPHLYFIRRLHRLFAGRGPRWDGFKGVLGSFYRLCTEIPRRERYGDLANWMKLENSKGLRSTFFFLPYGDGGLHIYDGDYRFEDKIRFDGRPVRVSEAIKEMSDAGWEIGLHGTIQSASTPGLLKRQKALLESIIQVPIVSVRQHFLTYDPELTPNLQMEAGFQFDSTHGLNQKWGFPSGTSRAYPLWGSATQQALNIIELPLGMMDTAERLPQAGKCSLAKSVREAFSMVSEVERRRGVLVMNWHPHYWSMGIAKEVFEAVVDEGLQRRAYIGPLKSVGEHAWFLRGFLC